MSLVSRLLVFLACAQAICAQPTGELLTNALDVLSLPADRALSGVAVSLQGVVTVAQPDWGGRFFLQDATAGIFVENVSDRHPVPGDLIRVTGASHPGGFAPIITQPRWEKLGTAPLPTAKPVPIDQVMAGLEDSQRVEISGTVRTVRVDEYALVFHLVSGGYRFQAIVPRAAVSEPQLLVGAKVRLRGTAATSFNAQLRQLITMVMYVPLASDFIVEKALSGDPFAAPVLPLNSLGQYRRGRELNERVHVKGTVTYQRRGEDLFLQDTNRGIHVKSHQLTPVNTGDVVEAVGFLDFERFLPVLQDAVYRKTGEPRALAEPRPVAISELQAGNRHAELITLQGKLLDRARRQVGHRSEAATELTLQNSNTVFTVEVPVYSPDTPEPVIAIGSRVEATGTCLMEIEEDGALHSLTMLAPGWDHVRVLQKPSWWTPQRLLIGLAVLIVVLVIAITWVVMVSKSNAALQVVIRDKVKAQEELQQAHDLLEHRVAERTAQLKHEMTARKEAEVHFKATLAERTRLAQELHDTLEQSLTGIGLQLDTAAKLVEKDPAAGNRHVGLARSLMTQSQLELRRSIWDLRSRELEEFDLPSVMRLSAQQILEGTHVAVKVETTGDVRAPCEVVEENLLRIAQEALTNVIKHAGASEVRISLDFGPQAVTLRVKDNGRGFTPDNCPGAREGHFGLLGMSERAKRLNGHLRVTSTPGSGTCLEVKVPARLADETPETAAEDARGLI